MVAIVSGNSLGLDLTSLRTLGPQDFTGSAAHGRNGQGVYVNASNGNLVVQGLDGRVVAIGGDIDALRTYNSRGLLDDDNGDNWTNGYQPQPLQMSGSDILLTGRDGAVARFTPKAPNVWQTTDGDGAHDTIALDQGLGVYVWRDGSSGAVRHYEQGGAHRLLSSADASGNTIAYSYDAQGRVVKALDAALHGTRFVYDANGNLTQLRSVRGAEELVRVQYEYTNNRLTRVTVDLSPDVAGMADGDVYWTEYTYDSAAPQRLAGITHKDGSSLVFAYHADGRIQSVTDALGQATTFAYAGLVTSVTDPMGGVTRYTTDGSGQVLSIEAPASGGITLKRSFTYDQTGNVTSVVDGEGRALTFTYDADGNQIRQADSAGGVVERTFAGNQMVSEKVLVQADPDGAGPLQPSHLETRQVWHPTVQGRLLFVVSPEGRVTEHVYNNYGLHTSTIVYAGARFTGAPSALRTWADGQPRTSILRVDMAYDVRGELETRTTYAQVDATGAGIADGTHSVERFVYDQAGRLLQTLNGTGHSTVFTYDGLGRVLTMTRAGQTTITTYQDSQQKTLVKLANGLLTTSVFDLAGRQVAMVQSGGAGEPQATTRYHYDRNGRLRMTEDPTGRRQWILYTAAGHKAAEIDANGTMKEYGYDASGRVVWTRVYDEAVNVANLVTAAGDPVPGQMAGAVRPALTTSMYLSWSAYDDAGRLVRTAETIGVAGDVAVTELRYDLAGRLEREIRYAKAQPLASAAIPLPPATPGEDRITRYVYDRDGLLRGTLDAAGYLTEQRYDNAGRLVQRIAFATATDEARRDAGTLADLIPATAAQDIRNFFFYDGQGRRVGEIDGERYLTVHEYDGNGRVVKSTRHMSAVTGTITTLEAAIAAAGASQTQATYAYDAAGRLVTETNMEGTVTRHRYDAVGNLTSTTRAYGLEEARSNARRYDMLGRVTEELAPDHYARLRSTMTDAEVDAIWALYATRHAYDAAGRRISTTDALGQRTVFYYDADGALVYTVDPVGRVRERQYDHRGRLIKDIERLAQVATTGLTGGEVTAAVTNRLGVATTVDSITSYQYTRDGRVSTITSPTGNSTSSTYNAFGEVEVRVQGMSSTGSNREVNYEYDRRGLLVQSLRDPLGISATEKTTYDAFGRVTETTDAVGAGRKRDYDRLGRVVSTYDATGATRSTTFDAFNRVLTQSDALGNTTTYVYDVATRTVTVTTPEGIETKTASNRHGEIVSRSDGLKQVTSYEYDRNGQLTKTSTPITSESSTFDSVGRLLTTTDANGTVVKYTYDAGGRVVSRILDPGGLNLETRYAYAGREVRVTDPKGVVTLTSYDKKGRVATQVVDEGGLNLTTKYTYDPADAVLTVESPGGTVTRYVYDALGRREKEIVDEGGLAITRSWTYDAGGNVLATKDARGFQTRYVHDAEGRVRYVVDPVGGVKETRYDAEGRIVQTVAWANAIAVTNLGLAPTLAVIAERIAEAEQTGTETSHRVYDTDGRLVATVNATGSVVRYTLDKNGRVVSSRAYAERISMPDWTRGTVPSPQADSARDRRTFFVYDALGRALYTMDGTGAVTARAYDGNGNLLTEVAYAKRIPVSTPQKAGDIAAALEAVADGARDRSVSHLYDAAGRLRWSVDALGAVTQRVYDRNGNLVLLNQHATPLPSGAQPSQVARTSDDRKTLMTYDAANRLVLQVDAGLAVIEQEYDKDGNVVRRTEFATPISSMPTAGQAGTEAAIREQMQSAASDDRTTRYEFDAAGRNVRTIGPTGAHTTFVYDAAGNMLRRTQHATLGSRDLSPDDRITRFAYDGAGQLIFTVDPSGALQELAYDAVGRVMSHTRYLTRPALGTGDYGVSTIRTKVTATSSDQTEVYAYNAAGQKIRTTDAMGEKESYGYDGLGQRVAFTNKKGDTWTYSYDNARQLLTQTNSRGQALAYQYDAAGQLTEILDTQANTPAKRTTYAYDLGGRRLIEKTVAGGAVYQDNHLAYDAQGRLRDVADGRVRMQMTYDANGNRTYVKTTVRYEGTNGEATHSSTRYFLYDQMNRQTVVDAVDAEGTEGVDTHVLTYDRNGNRLSDTYRGYAVTKDANGNWTVVEGAPGTVQETYTYDSLNRLETIRRNTVKIDVRGYDAADRVITSGNQLSNSYLEQLERLVVAGHVERADIRINRYDANGRMLHQTVKSGNGTALQEISWDPSEAPPEVPAMYAANFKAEGYDQAGNVKGYTVFTHQGSSIRKYSTTFKRFEGYAAEKNLVSGYNPGGTDEVIQKYDANGQLVEIWDDFLVGHARKFVNDAEGRALYSTRDTGEAQRQLIVNGEVLGRYGIGTHELIPTDGENRPNFTNVADFNFSFAPISPTYPAPAPGAYTVRTGETLQTIAKGASGDQALWYRIAEANGLSSNEDLRVGQVLNIPNRVGTIHNNDGTFKPYDPSRITGDVTPHMPLPDKGGCGAAGQVLMVIVAIVVTIYTAGAAATSLAGAGVGTGGAAVTAGGFATTMSTGAAAVTGKLGLAGALGAVAGGAAGSVASQLVGMATGVQSRFDWKGVALSGISAGVTAGVGSYAATLGLSGSGPLATIGRAVVANVATQGLATAVGLQSSFNWKSVAAAGVCSAVGYAVGDALGMHSEAFATKSFGEQVGARLISGLAAGSAASLARGGKVVAQQVAVDAFGNALGQSLAGAVTSDQRRATEAVQLSDAVYGGADAAPALYTGTGLQFGRTSGNGSTPGVRVDASGSDGLGYAAIRATTPVEGRSSQASITPALDASEVATLRQNLGLPPEDAPDVGWQLADLGLRLNGTTGGYGPASRLSNLSPLVKPPAQAAATNGESEVVIDYAQHAETYTQPGADLGEVDLLKTFKGAALDMFVEWGARSPEGTAWRTAMGVSYALTDAALPGSYVEAASVAGAGPLLGKAITWGSSALHTAVSRYALTSWAAEDLGSLTVRGVGNVANWMAPVADGLGYASLNRLGLILPAVPPGPAIAGLGIKVVSPRHQPGVVTYGSDLANASGTWLDAGAPTRIPLQVATQLNGQKFNTFTDLQAAIWKAIAKDADLRVGFKLQAIGNMAEGNAPFAPLLYQNRQFGERFNLHHIHQIRYAGEVYNLSNIRIVSPKMHSWIHHPEVLLK